MRSKPFYIVLFLCVWATSLFGQGVTFNKDIAPIAKLKCAPCHNGLGTAPFTLLSYADFAKNAPTIKYVVANKLMPKWKPDIAYSHFENENGLTDIERRTIVAWIDNKMPKGKGSDKVEYVLPSNNSVIGVPDYSFELKGGYEIKGNGKETFATIKIPFEFEEEFYLRALEFLPDHRELIHHVSIFVLEQKEGDIDMTGGIDRYTYPPGDFQYPTDTVFNLYNAFNLVKPNEAFFWDKLVLKSHWQIGMTPRVFADDMGFKMPKKGVILIDNVHYKASMVDLVDKIRFNVFKHKKPVTRYCYSTTIGNGGLSEVFPPLKLNPGVVQKHHSQVVLPADMSLLDVTPHMHQWGREFIAFAITPAKDTIPIIKINNWDVEWQETYRFNPMLKIPKGSTLYIEGLFDNSTNNPNNPFNPPRFVGNSMRQHDEMLELIISFFDYKPGDEKLPLIYTVN